MKIVQFVTAPGGGAVRYTRQLADALDARGHAVELIYPGAHSDVAVGTLVPSRNPAVRARNRVTQHVALLRALRHAERHDADVFHVQAPLGSALRVATSLDVRRSVHLVVTVHDVVPHGGREPAPIRSRVDACVVHHGHLGAPRGIPAPRVHTIPHGSPPPSFTTEEERISALRCFGLAPDRPVWLVPGVLRAEKDLDWLIGHAPPSVTLLAGGPPETWRPPGRSSTLARIDIGLRPEDDYRASFAAADVVVLPYRAFRSASGGARDAASFGVPIVAWPEPGFDELADAGLVTIVPAYDIDALCDAARDAGTSRTRSREAYIGFHQRTSWELVAARHEELYAGL